MLAGTVQRYLVVPIGCVEAAVVGGLAVESLPIERTLDLVLQWSIFWADSTTTLNWISSKRCKFHVYVANRVGEILETTEPSQWKYVPTALNPADDCTRGLNVAEINTKHRYLAGPAFLLESEETWPTFPTELPPIDENNPKVRLVGAVQLSADGPVSALIEKSSRCQHLLRVVAYVLRFVHKTRSKTTRPD